MREFKNVAELADCVGEEIGVSDWFSIDQDRINDFADATGDHQWIHIDPDQYVSIDDLQLHLQNHLFCLDQLKTNH